MRLLLCKVGAYAGQVREYDDEVAEGMLAQGLGIDPPGDETEAVPAPDETPRRARKRA